MALELWKSVVTTAILFLALIQTGLMLQVYGKLRLFPRSNKRPRLAHRLLGDLLILLALMAAALCLKFEPLGFYSARVALHIIFAALLLVGLGAKLFIVRYRRPLLRRAIGIGLLLLFLAIGTFATSALWYLVSW